MPVIALRPAKEGDVPFLLKLRALALEPHEQKAGLQPSEERRLERVRAHFESGQVIELAGQPIGVLKVIRSPQQWKLLQLQVLPQYQGRGIGTDVVLGVLEQARAVNQAVVLTVLKENPAKRLYERVGFKVVGEREHVYEMRVGG
jgi:ribosomal protein S18 acetylase RimI-like enzyme